MEQRLGMLYRQYGPVIYWRCVKLLGDRAAAEDATQETFMRVHRHLDRAPDEAMAWIFRIATNLCLNEIRNRRRRPHPVEDLPDVGVGGDVERLLADRELVLRLCDRVAEKLRAPAWLHFVDGLAQEEVARILDVSRRTVQNRIAAFTERARKYLGRAA